jgi:hypothetical protein
VQKLDSSWGDSNNPRRGGADQLRFFWLMLLLQFHYERLILTLISYEDRLSVRLVVNLWASTIGAGKSSIKFSIFRVRSVGDRRCAEVSKDEKKTLYDSSVYITTDWGVEVVNML